MALKIYNTLTRQTVPFTPLRPDEVSMYVCGPTVYSDSHIGHAMSALVFDVVRRYLEWSGFRVRHVMNFTDVDDKIIRRANEQGRDPMELANAYAETFLDQLRQLNIMPATAYPRVSTTMPGTSSSGRGNAGSITCVGSRKLFAVAISARNGPLMVTLKLNGMRLIDLMNCCVLVLPRPTPWIAIRVANSPSR